MIAPWTPERMRPFDRFNRMMEEFFETPNVFRNWMPTVDVKETDNEFTFVAELPGVREENIDVEVIGDALHIRGRRDFMDEEKREDYVRIERSYGTFHRMFTLEHPVKPDDIVATFKDGLLMVRVPKLEGVKPYRVEVRTN